MIKKLVKHGNSQAIMIEKAILDLLNIDMDTELEVTTDGTSLTITPREKIFNKALNNTFETHRKSLKKLADK